MSERGISEKKTLSYTKHKTILIVDDNLINRDLLAFQLRDLGLDSQYATNGQEAVELLKYQPEDFSLVLMDLNMPVMDGFTATKRIREHETKTDRHISIIALTANAIIGTRELCLEAGKDDYLSKPASINDIKNAIETWLLFEKNPIKP